MLASEIADGAAVYVEEAIAAHGELVMSGAEAWELSQLLRLLGRECRGLELRAAARPLPRGANLVRLPRVHRIADCVVLGSTGGDAA